MKERGLAASHGYCRAQTRAHARSFYFASVALPPEKRRAAYAVYAFCRYADDLVDCADTPEKAAASLAGVGVDFDRLASSGGTSELPFAEAFAWAVRRYGIPKSYFMELLAGVAGDLGVVRIADWPELRQYCYRVASVVGLIMARIFELRDEAGFEHAVELGLAMQLTNIIRDVGEDYRMGRIYLPANELAEFGVAEADLAAAHAGAALKTLLREHTRRAREFYLLSEPGVCMLPDDGSQLTVWLIRHVYAGILEEVERNDYDVLSRRAATSMPRKLMLALRAWRGYRRARAQVRTGK